MDSFNSKGQIGDVMGGITAPVIGLLNAILVYFALTAQTESNRIAQEEANFRYLLDEMEKLNQAFTTVEHYNHAGIADFNPDTGFVALNGMVDNIIDSFDEKKQWAYDNELSKLYFLFTQYSQFLEEVNDLSLSEKHKKIVEKKIWLYHAQYLSELFSKIALFDFQKPKKEAEGHLHRLYEVKFSLVYSIIYSVDELKKNFDNGKTQ